MEGDEMKEERLIRYVVASLVIGIFLICMGFHNVDLAYNFKGTSDSSFDCNLFDCVNMDILYMRGITMMIIGAMLCAIITAVLLIEILKQLKLKDLQTIGGKS
jgi:hypothetical protein